MEECSLSKHYSSFSPQENFGGRGGGGGAVRGPTIGRKRRRSRGRKGLEEEEQQRRTHITVERNRRKLMNDYLHVLRSMMPPSYAQRGDQASIVGGAINFLKEVEQLLQSLEAQKWLINNVKQYNNTNNYDRKSSNLPSPLVFSDFFTCPQYSNNSVNKSTNNIKTNSRDEQISTNIVEDHKENQDNIANVEVTMVESHASLKLLTKRHPKQLLKLVLGFCSLGLSILHLNVTTVDQFVLYSLIVKVEEESQLNSVNEIASAVYGMVGKIQEEATCDNFSCDS